MSYVKVWSVSRSLIESVKADIILKGWPEVYVITYNDGASAPVTSPANEICNPYTNVLFLGIYPNGDIIQYGVSNPVEPSCNVIWNAFGIPPTGSGPSLQTILNSTPQTPELLLVLLNEPPATTSYKIIGGDAKIWFDPNILLPDQWVDDTLRSVRKAYATDTFPLRTTTVATSNWDSLPGTPEIHGGTLHGHPQHAFKEMVKGENGKVIP